MGGAALGIACGVPRGTLAQAAAFRPVSSVPRVAEPPLATPVRPVDVLASAVLPGSGQLLSGRDRGAVFVILETALLARFVQSQVDGRHERDRYRELAFSIARSQFQPQRRDTVFEYFEQMERYVESGPYNASSDDEFMPATDPRSYNGAIWELARATYFTNPDSTPAPDSDEYQRAIAFYRNRAIGPNYQWSWRNAGLEQDLFRQAIRRSDDAFRHASQQLGLLLANHLLSALDTFVAYRVGRGSERLQLTSTVWSRGPGKGLAARSVVTLRF